VGLVREEAGGLCRTPSLLVVPIENLFVIVGVPPSYPTATRPCLTWFDMSSYVVAKALPSSLASLEALDVCAGSGVQSLLMANRSARSVVALEINEEAVEIARANVVLNGLGGRVEVRKSDVLSALQGAETFDFVVCNTPYAPIVTGPSVPASSAMVGNSVLWALLERLPAHLRKCSRGILASWRAAGSRSSTYQMRSVAARLEAAGYSAASFVDRAPDTLESVLRLLEGDLQQRLGASPATVEEVVRGVRALFEHPEAPMDGFYNQLICFEERDPEPLGERTGIFGLAAAAPVA
jgi:hypothetical protein